MQESSINSSVNNKLSISNDLTEEAVKKLTESVKKDSILEIEFVEIDFENINLITSLFNFIFSLKDLNNISFSYSRLAVPLIEKICECLEKNLFLKKLYLIKSSIDDKRMNLLADTLQKNSSITLLSLIGTSVNTHIRPLIQQLRNNKSLTTLILSGHSLGLDEMQDIRNLLETNTSLQELNFSANKMGDIGLNDFIDVLIQGRRLHSLNLAFNELSSSVSNRLATAVKISQVRILNLSYNSLYNFSEYSAFLFAKNTTLEVLNLSFNGLSDNQIIKLFSNLVGNQTIKYLNLSGNELVGDCIVKISEFLKQNISLLKLILNKNKISKNINCLIESLSANTSLRVLSLNNNEITNSDIKKFESLFKDNITLQKLNLKFNLSENLDEIKKNCLRNKNPHPLQYEILTAKAKKVPPSIPSLFRLGLFASRNYLQEGKLTFKSKKVTANDNRDKLLLDEKESTVLCQELTKLVLTN